LLVRCESDSALSNAPVSTACLSFSSRISSSRPHDAPDTDVGAVDTDRGVSRLDIVSVGLSISWLPALPK
jgi:hypothetical protein